MAFWGLYPRQSSRHQRVSRVKAETLASKTEASPPEAETDPSETETLMGETETETAKKGTVSIPTTLLALNQLNLLALGWFSPFFVNTYIFVQGKGKGKDRMGEGRMGEDHPDMALYYA